MCKDTMNLEAVDACCVSLYRNCDDSKAGENGNKYVSEEGYSTHCTAESCVCSTHGNTDNELSNTYEKGLKQI